jgi:two-component system invasion response regulator UvrY
MNILLVDDHAIVRDGLRRLLQAATGDTVFEAEDGRQALDQVAARRIDLVILDLNLPGLGGLELLRRLVETARVKVLVLSMHAEPLYAARALDAGAAGYVSKNASPDELLAAVQRVGAGGRYVENEIAQALGRGLAEIAEALGVRYKTVANTCSQMKSKLGVSRTADLVRLAIETGIH